MTPPCKKAIVTKPKRKISRIDLLERPRHGSFHFATWNVLSLNRAGSLRKLNNELTKYKIGIMVIQEVKWIGSDILDSGEYRVFYSRNENNTFGTGFVVHRDYKGSVLGFQPINERICTLRVKAHFFNICFIVHKKNEKTICSNYRGISLLSVLSKILAKRLNQYIEDILGDYQCGFRRDRSTTDQIFVLRNIL
jgi:exonuclease III